MLYPSFYWFYFMSVFMPVIAEVLHTKPDGQD